MLRTIKNRELKMNNATTLRTLNDLPSPRGLPLVGNALQLLDSTKLHHQLEIWAQEFGSFFLVNIGMQLNLTIFNDTSVVMLALLVTVIAVATKVIGCGLGALSLGTRGALQVGVGMAPRGEVGIVVAQIGLGMGVISDSLFGVVLFMAIATTLIAPPFLRPLFAKDTG